MDKLIFDSSKVQIVDISKVTPNPWNPKDKETEDYQNVKRGIELKGLRLPIVVRTTGDATGVVEQYEIIDGEQRYTACKELGYEKIIIYNEGVMDDKTAKELTIWYQQQVPFNEIKLADLVADLAKNYTDIELPYSQDKIDEFLKMNEFDWNDFENQETPNLKNMQMKTIRCTDEQYEVVKQAMDLVKQEQEGMSDGRAIELICAEFLASPKGTLGLEQQEGGEVN